MNDKTVQVTIENVGPHKGLTLELRHGVNVLVGLNGCGKTTAATAVAAALGDRGATVEPRDGVEHGKVTVGGVVVLHVGRHLTRKGTPTVGLASLSPVGDLVDPGIQDLDRADAARVKALLSLLPIEVTAEVLRTLSGGEPLHELPASGSVLEVADAIRRGLHARANDSEKASAAAIGEAVALEKQLAPIVQEHAGVVARGDGGETFPSAQEAARLHLEAQQVATQTWLLASQRAVHEAQVDRIRESLGERPDIGIAQAVATTMESEATFAASRCATIREELRKAELAEAAARTKADTAADASLRVQATAAEWDRRKNLVDAPVKGPNSLAATAAEEAAGAAGVVSIEASAWAQVAKFRELKAIASAQAEGHDATAKRLRDLATGVSGRLGTLLAGAGAEGLTVEDGRLYATLDGRRVLFADRFSFGQKVAFALGLALRTHEGRVVSLDSKFWLGLDSWHQAEVDALAKKMGVYVLTEAPGDGDTVTVEHVGGGTPPRQPDAPPISDDDIPF